MRLSLDGVWFRFAGWQGNYDTQPWSITLTFESELATLMRQQDEPFKWSRGKGTRLGFIHNLAVRAQNRDLSDRGILTFTTYSPDPFAKEDVAKIKDADRKKGLSKSAHLTIKGNAINAEQRRNLEISSPRPRSRTRPSGLPRDARRRDRRERLPGHPQLGRAPTTAASSKASSRAPTRSSRSATRRAWRTTSSSAARASRRAARSSSPRATPT
jgi:hypothetical protein